MRIELKASKNRLSVVIRVTSCSEGSIGPHMLTGIIAPSGREQDASKVRARSNLRSPQSASSQLPERRKSRCSRTKTAMTGKLSNGVREAFSNQSDWRSDGPQ
jgi:hypothetical protein